MKKIVFLLCLLFLLVGFCQTASALPAITVGQNEMYYRNYESVFRLDTTSGDYVELDFSGNYDGNPDNVNVEVNDIFVGIVSFQNITKEGSTVWSEDPGVEELTGIFAQQVTAIDDTNPSNLTIDLGFTSATDFTPLVGDSFSTGLAANEMFKIYLDADTGSGSNLSQFTVNTTIAEDVDNATDGVDWMTLGYDGAAPDNEYGWSLVTPHGTALDEFAGNSYLGLTVLQYLYGLENVGDPLLNDPGEERYDTDVQWYANSELEGHDGFVTGRYSDWQYASNDPSYINGNPIPEPATMFLFGFGLLGFAFAARRRTV